MSDTAHILVVDDDERIRSLLRCAFFCCSLRRGRNRSASIGQGADGIPLRLCQLA